MCNKALLILYLLEFGISSTSSLRDPQNLARSAKAQTLETFSSNKKLPPRFEICFETTTAATTTPTTTKNPVTSSSIRDVKENVEPFSSNAPPEPSFMNGYTLITREIDVGLRDNTNNPILRCETKLTYGSYEAIYTCVPSLENNSYVNLEQIRRIESMGDSLHEALKFSAAPGIVDPRANPMLRCRLNSSVPGKGGDYVFTEGWAKIWRVDNCKEVEKSDKNVAVCLALLNDAERVMLYKYDGSEGIYDRLRKIPPCQGAKVLVLGRWPFLWLSLQHRCN
ncbi:unnamed protein product [Diplocarpon coronariae]